MKTLSAVIITVWVVVTTHGLWVDPPATMPAFFPGRINITWDSYRNYLDVSIIENTGVGYNGSIPLFEMHFDKNTSDGIVIENNFDDHELIVIDGKYYYSVREAFDADTMDNDRHYVSSPHTLPDHHIMSVFIEVIDYNDEVPQWYGTDYSNYTHELLETEEWGEEGDTKSAAKRAMFSMQFDDADKIMTHFSVEKDNPECRKSLTKEICDEILDLIEVDVPYEIVGRAFVRRAKGQLIDRDDRRLFVGDSNEHQFVITIWDTDKTNSLISNLTLVIGDRNDNAPQFSPEESLLITIRDVDVVANKSLGLIEVRDSDDPKTPNAQLSVTGTVVRDPPSATDPDPSVMFSWKLFPKNNGLDIEIVPTMNFTGYAATYTLMLQAEDISDEPLLTKKNYMVVVTDSGVVNSIM